MSRKLVGKVVRVDFGNEQVIRGIYYGNRYFKDGDMFKGQYLVTFTENYKAVHVLNVIHYASVNKTTVEGIRPTRMKSAELSKILRDKYRKIKAKQEKEIKGEPVEGDIGVRLLRYTPSVLHDMKQTGEKYVVQFKTQRAFNSSQGESPRSFGFYKGEDGKYKIEDPDLFMRELNRKHSDLFSNNIRETFEKEGVEVIEVDIDLVFLRDRMEEEERKKMEEEVKDISTLRAIRSYTINNNGYFSKNYHEDVKQVKTEEDFNNLKKQVIDEIGTGDEGRQPRLESTVKLQLDKGLSNEELEDIQEKIQRLHQY